MEHLARARHHLPAAGQERAGEALGKIAGRPAAIITFLDGLWIRRPSPRIAPRSATALAKLHLAGLDFPGKRDNTLSVEGWRPLYEHCGARANEVQRDLRELLAKELAHLEAAGRATCRKASSMPTCFPDNVFFLGERLSGLIDFYFACTDALAYDVAICLNAWCFETDHSYNVTKGRSLLQAYAPYGRCRGGTGALPMLARGAALRFLLTRLVDWFDVPAGALVRPKDPMEYFRKLRFHQAVASVRDYGIDG